MKSSSEEEAENERRSFINKVEAIAQNYKRIDEKNKKQVEIRVEEELTLRG